MELLILKSAIMSVVYFILHTVILKVVHKRNIDLIPRLGRYTIIATVGVLVFAVVVLTNAVLFY